MDFLGLYSKAIAVFVALETILIIAIVSTWDSMTNQYLHGKFYDIGSHDTSIFYLVVGTAISAIAGYAYDEISNRY
jgi:hypothetical protein